MIVTVDSSACSAASERGRPRDTAQSSPYTAATSRIAPLWASSSPGVWAPKLPPIARTTKKKTSVSPPATLPSRAMRSWSSSVAPSLGDVALASRPGSIWSCSAMSSLEVAS